MGREDEAKGGVDPVLLVWRTAGRTVGFSEVSKGVFPSVVTPFTPEQTGQKVQAWGHAWRLKGV